MLNQLENYFYQKIFEYYKEPYSDDLNWKERYGETVLSPEELSPDSELQVLLPDGMQNMLLNDVFNELKSKGIIESYELKFPRVKFKINDKSKIKFYSYVSDELKQFKKNQLPKKEQLKIVENKINELHKKIKQDNLYLDSDELEGNGKNINLIKVLCKLHKKGTIELFYISPQNDINKREDLLILESYLQIKVAINKKIIFLKDGTILEKNSNTVIHKYAERNMAYSICKCLFARQKEEWTNWDEIDEYINNTHGESPSAKNYKRAIADSIGRINKYAIEKIGEKIIENDDREKYFVIF